ncbi:MAG: DUF4301 family protein [Syntrophales bacterium]
MTKADIRQLRTAGISQEKAQAQLDFLQNGVKPLRLDRPCTVGDGIVAIPAAELPILTKLHDEAAAKGRCMKFVPASGAASRMFTNWHNTLAKGVSQCPDFKRAITNNLPKFAFFPELKRTLADRGQDVETLLKQGNLQHILDFILSARGLNYGQLPKALLSFHNCKEGNRTALEEHLVEAALYTADAQGNCRIHFTISEGHHRQTIHFIEKICEPHEARLGITLQIEISTQSPASQTMAMEGGKLARDAAGRLMLRPGGHGALLENLNALKEGDIIFIKNIDNVTHDKTKAELVLYKKALGGYFVSLQEESFRHLRNLSAPTITLQEIGAARRFCENKLSAAFSTTFTELPLAQQRERLAERLHRPLRVCGMVRNEGEPGGGPFWVAEGRECSLQIVERHQIDACDSAQSALWDASTHFNPVDIVCGLRDYQGKQFDLAAFVDQAAFSLTEKNEKGRQLKVLEYPGLWNGSMSRWNTVFVEVPNATFSPVKTIDDLLKPGHQMQ